MFRHWCFLIEIGIAFHVSSSLSFISLLDSIVSCGDDGHIHGWKWMEVSNSDVQTTTQDSSSWFWTFALRLPVSIFSMPTFLRGTSYLRFLYRECLFDSV